MTIHSLYIYDRRALPFNLPNYSILRFSLIGTLDRVSDIAPVSIIRIGIARKDLNLPFKGAFSLPSLKLSPQTPNLQTQMQHHQPLAVLAIPSRRIQVWL